MPKLSELPTDDLVEQLCLRLRDVGVHQWDLRSDRALAAISSVRELHTELVRRGRLIDERLSQLSTETGWRTPELLADCLAYPQRLPLVRDLNGVSAVLRCKRCEASEMPDRDGIRLCDACLADLARAIESRIPSKRFVLLRTFNSDVRCSHADEDTVLCLFQDPWEEQPAWPAICATCADLELARRRSLLRAPPARP